MVYMDLYPVEGKDFALLKDAIDKLGLNDAALRYQPVSSQALGKGFRVGFLGALHAEIVLERLRREHNLDLVPTAPTVVYKVTTASGDQLVINNPSDLPDPSQIDTITEPIAAVTIFTPDTYLGNIMKLASESRGELINQTYFGPRVKLEYLIPLAELIINFFDQLKSASQGYASLEYQLFEYQQADVVKLTILINKEPIEALSQLVIRSKIHQLGKRLVAKLTDAIPRQLFDIPIQAAMGGDILARDTIKAYRKDVTAKLYGGDITRRMKLLEKQKKGKSKRSQFAKVNIPQSAYLAVLKQ
jgi:GTP-binding protein LepA